MKIKPECLYCNKELKRGHAKIICQTGGLKLTINLCSFKDCIRRVDIFSVEKLLRGE